MSEGFSTTERKEAERQIREVNRLGTAIIRKEAAIAKAEERLKKAKAWEAQAHTLVVQRDDDLAGLQQDLLELRESLEDAEELQRQPVRVPNA